MEQEGDRKRTPETAGGGESRRLMKEFLGYTTTPGLGRFYTAPQARTRAIWGACLLLIYAGFIAHTYVVVQRYLSKPLQVSVNNSIAYMYPDVYLCNYNPISASRLVGPLDSMTQQLYKEGALDYRSLQFDVYNDIPMFVDDVFKNWPGIESLDFNSYLSPAASQLLRLYRKLQDQVVTDFYANLSSDRECRVTLNGSEYSGSQDSFIVYNVSMATGSQVKSVISNFTCLGWNAAAAVLVSSGRAPWSAGTIRGWNLSDSDRRCRSPRDLPLTAVLMETNWTSRTAEFFNGTDRLSSGPYCFFMDSWGQLLAHYCGVPFCELPSPMNCLRRDVSYTGLSNRTVSGKPCLTWDRLSYQNPYMYDIGGGFAALDNSSYSLRGWNDTLRYALFPDNEQPHVDNYCRQIQLFEYAIRDNLKQFTPMWRLIASSDVPSCFVPSTEGTGSINYMDLEQCAPLPMCYKQINSLSKAFKDTIGKAALLRSFGNDMSINLLSCSFNGQTCTANDFVTILHPEFGVCHRFTGRERLIKPGQSQAVSLELKLFVDKFDTFGREHADLSEIEISTQSDKSVPGVTGFRAVLAPQGTAPYSKLTVDLKTGHRTYIDAAYNEFKQYMSSPPDCIPDEENGEVTYVLPHWRPGPTMPDPVSESDGDWRDLMQRMKAENEKDFLGTKMTFQVATKRDCEIRREVSALIDACGCLPSNLPLPLDLTVNRTYCFNMTAVTDMLAAENCYTRYLVKRPQVRADATSSCLKPCTQPSYTLLQSATLWPQHHREDTRSVLKDLTDSLGFPTLISRWRGLNSLYFALKSVYALEADWNFSAIGVRSASDAQEILPAARSSIMWVNIVAHDDYGQLLEETEVYPITSLMSDFGGNLGLWSGICCVAVAELLELLVTMAILWLGRGGAPKAAVAVGGGSAEAMTVQEL